MSESEVRVSGDLARLIDRQCDVGKLLRQHTPDGKGRCPTCKSIGCSLYTTVLAVQTIRAKHDKRLGGSKP